MSPTSRRRLLSAMAVLACVAMAAKVVKGIYRGETMQSRVRPLN